MTYVMTTHALTRQQQRGYRDLDVNLVLTYGTEAEEGIFLRRKDCERAAAEIMAEAREAADRVKRMAGTFVPMDGGTILSIYPAGTRKAKKVLKR